jgi:SanA protein
MRLMMKRVIKIIFATIMIVIVIVLAGTWAINAHMIWATKDRIVTPEAALTFEADAIMVLGAGVNPNKTPSVMLADRLLQGIELYEIGVSDRILMSGDNSTDHYDEVTVMKNYAIRNGVPSAHIFKDHAGFNTYNSMYRANAIFEVEKLVIVTQEYHLYRALYIADKLGLEAIGVASNPQVYSGQESRDFREVLARVKNFFLVIYKPDPTFLGNKIPITGDGDARYD